MKAKTPSLAEPIIVELGDGVGQQKLSLRYDMRAQYRLQQLPRNNNWEDLRHPKRGFSALVNWVWACWIGCPFDSPEDMANLIKLTDIEPLFKTMLDVVKKGTDAPSEAKKAS